jgi:2-polyprenyl-3-methyl-5-hydroxy-6-metoxy-1,4-benzoquinol methylase
MNLLWMYLKDGLWIQIVLLGKILGYLTLLFALFIFLLRKIKKFRYDGIGEVPLFDDRFEIVKTCIACGSSDFKLMSGQKYQQQPIYYMRCNKCGLIFGNPLPNNVVLEEVYAKENYRGPAQIYEENSTKEFEKDFQYMYRLCLDRVKKFKSGGRILDVGCGLGTFLSLAREEGWETYGIELSEICQRELQRKGLTIYEGNFSNIPLPINFYDVITLYSVIEHLRDPLGVLEKCNRILKENGFLVFSLPNFGYSFRVIEKNWRDWGPLLHIFIFNRESVERLMEKSGFSIIEIEYSSIDGIFTKRTDEVDFVDELYQSLINILNKKPKGYLFSIIHHYLVLTANNGLARFAGDCIIVYAKKNREISL